jgi:hypothetical protein
MKFRKRKNKILCGNAVDIDQIRLIGTDLDCTGCQVMRGG